MLIRLCKTALVASIAVFFALVAFGNITDYQTNAVFVRHVLAMDSIFPDSHVHWRAITSPVLVTGAYILIIAWEAATAIVLAYATARLLAASGRGSTAFAVAKGPAVLGLTMALLLYGLGFSVIGGEWFAMWQSQTWNGLTSAARFILLAGIVLIVLLLPEPGEA